MLEHKTNAVLSDGASLIYTTPFIDSSIQPLVHSSLGIHSLLKKQSLKHNVIDRDKILVPPNWDSWGKIRILRDGFDLEGISDAWSVEIQAPSEAIHNGGVASPANGDTGNGSSAVAIYEETIRDPKHDTSSMANGHARGSKIEVETLDTQTFLAEQAENLQQLRDEDERAAKRAQKGAPESMGANGQVHDSGSMDEQIGPVQTNVGGIQVDADDILKKLKVHLRSIANTSSCDFTS